MKYIIIAIIILIILTLIINYYKKEAFENSEGIVFINDNNVKIILNESPNTKDFINRPNKEKYFRLIITYLINNSVIKNNIIDLGAWIGDNSIPWSKNIKDIIYAIEPSIDNCNYINELCSINNINNVKVLNFAISDKNEKLFTNDSLLHSTFNNNGNGKNVVNAVSLDYLYEEKKIDNIGFIHLDVEGMENKVINGSYNIINTFNPVIAFEQHLNTDNYTDLINILKNKNYKVFLINEILEGNKEDCRNFIAFPLNIYNDELIHNINNNINTNDILTIQ
jgi:FkbM family methyltransferase